MTDDGLKIFRDEHAVPEDTTRRLVPAAVTALVLLVAAGLAGMVWAFSQTLPIVQFFVKLAAG